MYLVDLPGYGYAKVSAAEKEKWGKMIEGYLHNSKELCAVFSWWISATSLPPMTSRCMTGSVTTDMSR